VVAATDTLAPPDRGLRYYMRNQTRWSATILVVGAATLLLLFVGSIIVLSAHGWTRACPPGTTRFECSPSDPLAEGLGSAALGVVAAASLVGGLVVAAASAFSYRRMPTRSAREAVVTGGVLGLQAMLLALLLAWFRGTDLELFARNFLNIRRIGDNVGLPLENLLADALGILRLGVVWGAVFAGIAWAWVRFRHGSPKTILGSGVAGTALGVLWGILGVSSVPSFAKAAQNTLILSVWGATLGFALGLVLAMFAMSKRAVVRAPARVYINFFRGTPLIWQMLFAGIGIVPALRLPLSMYTIAILVLGLNLAAYSAEVYRAGIQSLERGQIEASRALGLGYLQSMRYVIIPQAIRRVIPPLLNEFVILIKDTALVSVLGLTMAQRELLGSARSLYSATFDATAWLGAAAGYLIITLPLIRFVTVVEKRLRSGLTSVVG
jgi:polar amino acid transport system permease protein